MMNSVKINFLAKSDIAEAFSLLPLKPSEYNLIEFKLGDNLYFDKCLTMGGPLSVLHFFQVPRCLTLYRKDIGEHSQNHQILR